MKKILILENGSSISNMISNCNNNEDYEVLFAENISTADYRLPKQIPHLIIADLTTIKKDKVEILIYLKNNPVISMVPFLLITSNNGHDDNLSAFNYYLNKPFSKNDLYVMVRKILNKSENISPW